RAAALQVAALQAAALQVAALQQEHPSWAVYRERVLTDTYGQEVGQALGRWVRVERDRERRTLHIHNKVMDITDYGDRLVALQAASSPGGKAQEIEAMLKIAGAKGWKALTVTGTEDFQMRAGAAALAAGFTLTEGDLAARIVARQVKDAEGQRVKDLEVAPVLAEWMRAHPKQAQAQRLAGGQIPLLYPAGLDRSVLQRPALWEAAEAWTVGRYGETAQWQALSKDPDPLKAQAAAAGREAAINAGAQGGMTLKVGKDAPEGPGISWTLSGVVTRESVERYAAAIMDRRTRAGVDHCVTVMFGGDVGITRKILVLEHLLRQSVPLDASALENIREHRYALDQARERLKTHEPDGQQQAWYVRDLERKAAQRERDEAARIRADRVKKLDALALHLQRHGSDDAVRHFEEAGFAKGRDGFYVYPDPDLPGVQKVWDALAAAKRKETEEDLQKRADAVGYRRATEQWSKERVSKEPEYQRIAQEIQADPSLKEIANAAYQQGMERGRKDLEQQAEQERKSLRQAAHKLGRRAAAGSTVAKQAEIQREFGKLVQRGAELGLDEKALSQSLQKGRDAYQQELARSRSRGMGL
ncbi:hypothetical protein JKG47_19990, partial [Acidithiobacillus sp. MC6.1]|nr:hypothetical protein [Acidithiobacillus sp. MC6.1]